MHRVEKGLKLHETARLLIGSEPATLVTTNRDGSPQVSVAWMAVPTTADGDDELVTAHLREHQKIRNIRRDARVAVTVVKDRNGPFPPYLSIKGTARVEEGGAPELLDELTTEMVGPGTKFPPPDAVVREQGYDTIVVNTDDDLSVEVAAVNLLLESESTV
ncbi:MAG: hypothetical protein QOI90_593 [Mycobacterium sp.]|jgi:PPOX class probable F420-dependent enzyme|nr:hypothetical protein [Mycobacterium sp.]